jgi:hypothetical protein
MAKQRKPRRFAPALVISDTAEPAIYAAMKDGNIWPLLDILRSETCPRQAREFAADLIEGKVTLPKKKPKQDSIELCVIASHAYSKWYAHSGGKHLDKKYLKSAVMDAAAKFDCSVQKVYAAIRYVKSLSAPVSDSPEYLKPRSLV